MGWNFGIIPKDHMLMAAIGKEALPIELSKAFLFRPQAKRILLRSTAKKPTSQSLRNLTLSLDINTAGTIPDGADGIAVGMRQTEKGGGRIGEIGLPLLGLFDSSRRKLTNSGGGIEKLICRRVLFVMRMSAGSVEDADQRITRIRMVSSSSPSLATAPSETCPTVSTMV